MLRAAAKRGAATLRGGAQQSPISACMPTRARGMAGASPPATRCMRGTYAWHACYARRRGRLNSRTPSLASPSLTHAPSGGHGHGHGVEHGGLTLHPPKAWHTNVATGMAALTWCACACSSRALPSARVTRNGCNGRRAAFCRFLWPARTFVTVARRSLTLSRRFWVLLRWKEDGATLIFGHAPHFQHEIEEEEKAQGFLYAAGKKGGKSGH